MRLFPPLRAAWSLRGEQASVPVSGRNAKRVLFVGLNLRTGHRVALIRSRNTIEDFIVFLELLRRRYRHRPIALLLDGAKYHTHPRSQRRAAELDITFFVLPRQSPKLNPLDHLFSKLKDRAAANRQLEPIDELARWAVQWILSLTNAQALGMAALRAPRFWLYHLLKNFPGPT
jgi:transposase